MADKLTFIKIKLTIIKIKILIFTSPHTIHPRSIERIEGQKMKLKKILCLLMFGFAGSSLLRGLCLVAVHATTLLMAHGL